MFLIKSLAAIVVGALILWGYWHEDRFVEFENLLWRAAKKYVKERMKK